MKFKIELTHRMKRGEILNGNLLVLHSSVLDRIIRLFCKDHTITHTVELI